MSVLVWGDSNKTKFCASSSSSSETRQLAATLQDMGTTSREPQSHQLTQPPSIEGTAHAHDVGCAEHAHDFGAHPVENDSEENSHEEAHDFESESDMEDLEHKKSFLISPNVPLKDQLEKDKEDESLRRWKEQLLGSVQDLLDPAEESVEPKVQVLNFTILSDGRPEIVIPLPLSSNHKVHLFSLKEGCSYKIRFTFTVRHNIVSGLTYIHTVWKNGFKVEKLKTMLGTFGPRSDSYTHTMDEETTPSGIFARGSYTSRIQFVDDDGHSHLDIQHTFSISKEWQ